MKIKIWMIPLVIFIISAIILFRPIGRVTSDLSVSENRILVQYEIFGCGSLVRKVLDGGEEITANYISVYPEIGLNEVAFTDGSDEPEKHMDNVEFYNGGLAERYTYIFEGEPVGVAQGAPDCCEPKPAYNEKVVEFKVDKWYLTSYVPYIEIGDIFVILTASFFAVISIFWIIASFFNSKMKRGERNDFICK